MNPEAEQNLMAAPGKDKSEPRIHVAHIIFRLDVGGLENGLVNVINGLPGAEFNHTVICLDTFTEFSQRIRRADVQILALNKSPGLDPKMYVGLWRLLRQLRPDIVHTRNLGTLPCIAAAVLARVPVRIHGEHGWDMVDIGGRQTKYRLLRRFLSPFVSVYVAVSLHIADWLMNSVRISPRKVRHICNGVDTRRFHPRETEESIETDGTGSAAAEVTPSPIIVGTVGRLEHVKDPMTLIRAVIAVRQQRPDLARLMRVRFIGDGGLRQQLQQEIESKELSGLVKLCGRDENIPERLRELDLFVLPSLNEGISNTILEAMASGLPVIATAVGGNPEIVRDEETGLLVPPADAQALAQALIRYLEDEGLRRSHGARARDIVERDMSLQVMLDAYRELYVGALPAGKAVRSEI